jgi:hypothetical protein
MYSIFAAELRRADTQPGESQLGDRGIDDPPLSERVEQPAAHLVGALIYPDLLPHQEDVGVALHLLTERLVQCVSVRDGRHVSPGRRQ